MICPECKNETECYYCESTGEVSETLNSLYILGFRNIPESDEGYRIYLQKALNRLETLSVEIVKSEEELSIARIGCSGPTDFVKTENLDSVDQIIRFLNQKN